MQTFKLHLLYIKCLNSPLHCKINTNASLLVKSRHIIDEPGIRNRKQLYNDSNDEEFHEEMDEELDESVDFMKVNQAYDEHYREKKREKQRLQNIIIKSKFFAPRTEPSTLTYNEIQCIKYLHQENPIQWNISELSESFPATPKAIKKVLKSKCKFSPERIKKMDEKVQRNWKLLAEGKLDADPSVIEHLKKFTNRSPVLLEQIKNADFYLPEVKKEKVWNNGEMNMILSQYEKSIEEFNEKGNELQITKGMDSEKNCSADAQDQNSSLEILHEEVNKQVLNLNLEKKESFILGKMAHYFAKQVTLEELQRDILNKAEANKDLDLCEKAVLDSKLGITGDKHFKMEIEKLAINENTASQSILVEKTVKTRNSKNSRKNMQEKSNFLKAKAQKNENEYYVDMKNEYDHKHVMDDHFSSHNNEDIIPLRENETCLVSEVDIGRIINPVNVQEPKLIKQAKVIESKEMDPERAKRDSLYYDKEAEELKCTSFWNSCRNSTEKALSESAKVYSPQPKNTDRVSIPDIYSKDTYPARIKVPKSKQGSGLTFKVNDCYYDDDGEFLYRVPGMKN